MLLVVGDLLIASFLNVLRIERGFSTTAVVAANIELPTARYPDSPSRTRFFDALLEGLSREPGVVAAGCHERFRSKGSQPSTSSFQSATRPLRPPNQLAVTCRSAPVTLPPLVYRCFAVGSSLRPTTPARWR
jgi:hypothetical protein